MTYEAFEYKYGLTVQRVAYLVSRFLRQLLNDTEWAELDDWIVTNNSNQLLFEKMIEPERFEKESLTWYKTGVGVLEQKVLKALLKEEGARQPIYTMTWFRVSAAAVIIGAIVLGAFYFFSPRKDWTKITASIATVTTPDGKQIKSTGIDDTPQLLSGGGVISQRNGVLNYSFNGKQVGADRYYVVQVPEPFLYKMTLQDGSNLFFAPNTVLRFPESFNTRERMIEVRGKIYLEIAEEKRPFVVKFSNGEITSNNAHFNLGDDKGEYTAIVMAKGKAILKRDFIAAQQLNEGFRTTLEENKYTRHERVDVESFTSWRFGLARSMKHIFIRAARGEFQHMYDSIYNNDTIK